MSEALDELRAACQTNPAAGDAERINEGESVWLAGRPIAAERGLIGLSHGDGLSVFISEAAVLEASKEESFYFVRVPAGTAMLVRSEQVTTLRPGADRSGCRCSDEKPGASLQRAGSVANTPGGGSGPIIIRCPLVCTVDVECEWHLGGGTIKRVCYPVVRCRRECPSIPA